MEKVKVGIIGVGNIGSAHLKCIYNGEIRNMSVVAVCDTDEKRRQYVKKEYPDIALFDDAKSLIRESGADAVVVSVPHPMHAEIAGVAFKNGLHVLVEKPVDVRVSAAEELNDRARESGKVFAVMFNQRTNPLFKRAREIVKSGELGALKRSVWIVTNWYRTQSYYDSGLWRATWRGEGGGVLLNQAPHNLDLWQWICGMPETVTAFCSIAKFHNIEVEDEATIYTTYKNGATGVFVTSTGDYPGTNRLEISGTLGKLVLEEGILKHYRLKEDERKVCFESQESFYHGEYDYEEFKPTEAGTAHRGILQNFTNAIINGEELIADGFEGINELSISNAAYLSQWKGSTVKLPLDGKEFDGFLNMKISDLSLKGKNGSGSEELSKDYIDRWQVRW